MKDVLLYDTTLRDGCQAEDVSFTLEDKLRIAEKLDELGHRLYRRRISGLQPARRRFFQAGEKAQIARTPRSHPSARRESSVPNHRRISTSKLSSSADTPVVTLVGKTWDLHVRDDLRISQKANLEIIADSIAFMKKRVDEVIFDAEHFFDGFRANPDYAMECLKAAQEGGADWIVLCETNGGSLAGRYSRCARASESGDQDASGNSLPQRRRAGGCQHAGRRRDGRDPGSRHDQRLRRALRQRQSDFSDRQLAIEDGQEMRERGAAQKAPRGVAAFLRARQHSAEQAASLRRRQRLCAQRRAACFRRAQESRDLRAHRSGAGRQSPAGAGLRSVRPEQRRLQRQGVRHRSQGRRRCGQRIFCAAPKSWKARATSSKRRRRLSSC